MYPCIYDGELSDLLHQESDGLSEVLNHLSEWLGKAAINDLIDSEQGWEPIRRDNLFGCMVYDLPELRKIVDEQEGTEVFSCNYHTVAIRERDEYFVYSIAHNNPQGFSPGLVGNIIQNQKARDGDLLLLFVIFAWSDKEHTADRYLPEGIRTFQDLMERAEEYGCAESLQSRLAEMKWAIKTAANLYATNLYGARFHLFVILCARRPYPLIREGSSLELTPYFVDCRLIATASPIWGSAVEIAEDSPVRPLEHRHALTTSLLRQMSGANPNAASGSVVFVGCGSIGSKIAMHLARAGQGPFHLIRNVAQPSAWWSSISH